MRGHLCIAPGRTCRGGVVARRHGALALTRQVSTPGAEISHTTVLSMVHLIAAALAARVGVAAVRRRDLIDNLREELDPDE